MANLRSVQIAKRRSAYAAAALINRGDSSSLVPVGVPGKGRAANRTFRKAVATLVRKRRKAGEYHRGL